MPPIDDVPARRPADTWLRTPVAEMSRAGAGRTVLRRPSPSDPARRRVPDRAGRGVLDGGPAFPDSLYERYDRMNLRYAIDVLMGHRTFVRRLAAEC